MRTATVIVAVVLVACSGDDENPKDTSASSTDTSVVEDSATPDGDGAATEVEQDTSEVVENCIPLKDGRCVVETFANPPVLQPNAQGVYELELKPTEFSFNGQRHCGRSYNGVFPGPTIDTPAQVNGEARHVRVNLRNRFTKNAYHSISTDECTCTDSMDMPCTPSGGHAGHDDCSCKTPEGEMCHIFDFNVTNLHAHGSHVRPDYATGGGCTAADGLACRACKGDNSTGPRECFFADDVISRVAPGGGVQHRWDIDEDHVSYEGLNWYHPHIHGSTAIQVASGATGAWIVRGPVDALPGIAKATERIFLISTPPSNYTPLADGQPCDEDHITFDDFNVLNSSSANETNLINGKRQPRIVMPPGQIERWRFLHGSFLDEMTIAVFRGKDSECAALDFDAGPVPLTQISRDGITMPKPAAGEPGADEWPFAPKYLFLSPGYRIDTILDGSKLAHGDTLCIMSARFLQDDTTGTTDIPVGLLEAPTIDEILQKLGNGDLIGIVNVSESAGTASETTMPDFAAVAALAPPTTLGGGTVDGVSRCEEVKQIDDPDQIDQLAELWMIFLVNQGLDECSCPDHNINCKNFEHTDREVYPYDRVLPLGAVEHWRLIAGFDGHPFHIHINPYLVCPLPPQGSDDPSVAGRLFEPPFAHWRDTYLVNLQRQVDVLTEYRKFTGAFVQHCHKLNHEDHGMMELLRVCDPNTEDCNLCDGGPCRWDHCADGDTNCQRALTGTQCFIDPSRCPEAILRCTTCGDDETCPPSAHCDDTAGEDGQLRCLPGCEVDDNCLPVERCDDGTCVAAPPCGPCAPGTACLHGTCQ